MKIYFTAEYDMILGARTSARNWRSPVISINQNKSNSPYYLSVAECLYKFHILSIIGGPSGHYVEFLGSDSLILYYGYSRFSKISKFNGYHIITDIRVHLI